MNIAAAVILLGFIVFFELFRLLIVACDKKNIYFNRRCILRISLEAVLLFAIYLAAFRFVYGRMKNPESVRFAAYFGLVFEVICILIELKCQERIKKLMQSETIQKYAMSFAVILLITCGLELTIFNFRHFQTLKNMPAAVTDYLPSGNFGYADTNAFEVLSADTSPYIEVKDIDIPVSSLYMDVTFANLTESAVRETKYHLEFVDDGNANYYQLPQRVFVRQVPQSHYDVLNLYGNCHSFRLYFDNVNVGDIIRINDLQLNVQYPFLISVKRTLFLTILFFLLFILRPKSIVYQMKYNTKFHFRRMVFVVFFILQAFFFWKIVNMNLSFINPQSDSEKQFALLTEGLAEGKPYLLIDPPQTLVQMDDPYDYIERMRVVGDENVLWDTAYYDGHYYVYFGIGPIVVFYLPYYLITGTHIPTFLVVYICSLFVIAGVMLLLSEIVKRWFNQLSLPLYLMFSLLCINGCGALYLLTKADFYAVPLMMGLANVLWGLYFWMNTLRTGRKTALKLFAGSFCMAFVAACRPQFLLGSFLAVLLFWDMVFKERRLFSKKSIVQTAGFVLLYILIAAGVMFYNELRFGSPFDFGANYNLTFNNMPYRGIRLDRLLYGTVGFLFFPCSVTNSFPYFGLCNYISRYQGITADEQIFGGMIYNQIYLLPTLFVFKFKKYFADRIAYRLAVITPIFGLLIMLVDSNMAGTLTRYFVDFTWLFMISFFLILGMINKQAADQKVQACIRTVFYVCFVITVIRSLLSIFGGDGRLSTGNVLLFQTVSHLAEFWN